MIRKTFFLKLHRWIGIVAGLFLLVQGLTGATLAFRDDLEPIIQPSLRVVVQPVRLPVQALLDAFHAAHPDAELQRAEVPDSAAQAVIFKWKAKKGARGLTAIDPYSGRVVRDGLASVWPLEVVFNIHEQLLSGPIGETVIGIEGLALLTMAISGLIYWWPARFRQGFRVKLDGSRDMRWRTLHRAVGGVVAWVLIMSATTGVLMVWKEPFRAVLSTVTKAEARPSPKVEKQDDAAMFAIDPLIAAAKAHYGDTPLRQLRFSSGGRVVAVYLVGDRTIRADGTTQVYFNRYDGSELAHYVAGTQSPASEFLDWIYTVHTGLWGGAITQAMMLLVGLTLAGMAASGLWLWASRTARARKRIRKNSMEASGR